MFVLLILLLSTRCICISRAQLSKLSFSRHELPYRFEARLLRPNNFYTRIACLLYVGSFSVHPGCTLSHLDLIAAAYQLYLNPRFSESVLDQV